MKNLTLLLFLLLAATTYSQDLGTGTTRAVVIGISDYLDTDIPDLQYADKDALAFASYLRSPAGGNLEEEQILALVNEEATTARIADALTWLVEESQNGDRAVIYFSGHGDVETISKFQRGFLLTYDSPPRTYVAGAFGLVYLQDIISTLSESGVQVVMVSDACRAGKLAGSSIGGTQATTANLAKQFANEIKILSCQPNEFSLEGEQWGGGRGVFSFHLIEGLYGLADRNQDLAVNLLELENYLEYKVPEEVAPQSQIPMTVGYKVTRLSTVDQDMLLALQEEKAKSPKALSPIVSKGLEEAVLADADSNLQEMYRRFQLAMEEGRLLAPKDDCAYDLYQLLSASEELQAMHGLMRRNLAVAFQEDAQLAINAYLKANPTELTRRYNNEKDFGRYPAYLEKAAELLGPDHFYFEALLGKKLYFEGLQQRLENEASKGSLDEYWKAVALQNKALQYEPHAAYIFNELGVLYTRLRNHEKASEHFEKAIELAPEWGLPYINYCLELHYNNQQQDAVKYGEKALKLMPEYPQLYNLLGYVYANLLAYKDKRNWARRGVELKEDYYYLIDNVSTGTQLKSKLERTRELLQQAIKIDEDYAAGQRNLGLVYLQSREIEKAIYHLKRAAKLDPDDDRTFTYLGIALMKLNRFQEAEQANLKAIELTRKLDGSMLGEWHANLSILYQRWGKWEKALEAIHKAIDEEPANGVLWNAAAYLYFALGRIDRAELYYLKGLKNTNDLPRAYYSLGNFYFRINRFEDAEWMYRQALELKSDYLFAYYALQEVYQKTGQFQQLLSIGDTVLSISADLPLANIEKGKGLFLNKQFKLAEAYFQKAVSLDPTNGDVLGEIGIFYLYHDRIDLAEAYYNKVLDLNPSDPERYAIPAILSFFREDFDVANQYLDSLVLSRELPALIIAMNFHILMDNEEGVTQVYSRLVNVAPQHESIKPLVEGIISENYTKVDSLLSENPAAEDYFLSIVKHRIRALAGNYEEVFQTLGGEFDAYPLIMREPSLEPIRDSRRFQHFLRIQFPEKYEDLDTFQFVYPPVTYFPENCVELGNIYRNDNEFEKALTLYEKALDLQPGLPEAILQLANLYLIKGKRDTARELLQANLNLEGSDLNLQAGEIYHFAGFSELSLKYFQKGIAASVNHYLSNRRVGMFFWKYNEPEMAVPYLKAAIALAPNQTLPYRVLSRSYFLQGDQEAAHEVLDQAIAIPPLESANIAQKYFLYYFAGEKEKAKAFGMQANAVLPGFSSVQECLDLVEEGQLDAAFDMYEQLKNDYNDTWWLTFVKYALLKAAVSHNEEAKALQLLDEILSRVRGLFPMHFNDPELEEFRETGGYKALIRRYYPERY